MKYMQTDYAAYHLNEGDDDGLRVYLQKMTLCLFFSFEQRYAKKFLSSKFFLASPCANVLINMDTTLGRWEITYAKPGNHKQN